MNRRVREPTHNPKLRNVCDAEWQGLSVNASLPTRYNAMNKARSGMTTVHNMTMEAQMDKPETENEQIGSAPAKSLP